MPNDFNVERIRQQFPGLARQVAGRPAVFLDGPGGTQVPRRVIDAVADVLAHRNANDGGHFATSRDVGTLMANAKQAAADLLGAADPETVVFGQNMTTLTFALSRSLAKTWKPGDEIVVTRLDHDANYSPWTTAAADAGAIVREVSVSPDDCTLILDNLNGIVNSRTRLIAVGLASNAVGTVNPVAELVAAARRVGAVVFLDAVHAAPHLLTNVEVLGVDFLACSAYKFFGPHMGILWGRRELLEQLPAYKVRPAPEGSPGRWMTGTPNFEGIAGILAAVDYLASLGDVGPTRRDTIVNAFAAIEAHERNLARRFLDGVRQLPDWKIWGNDNPNQLERRVSTFGLTHRERTAKELAIELGDQGLFVWNGHFYAVNLIDDLGLAPSGLLRIGFLHYNTTDEVDRLVESLAKISR